ncbi:MAG: NAD-dependent epimerase/dehydratase family protein [Nanoarchaeota archaeon]
MNVLVTGGAGFIGSHLVDKLLEQNQKVIVIDDFSLGKEENLEQHNNNQNLTIYKKSICEDLTNIFKENKIETVFHVAALPRVQFSIQNPIETHNANVNGTINLLNLCKKFNAKRFIFSSSSSIYGDQDKLPLQETFTPNPMSPYALHKLIGEHYCTLFHKLYKIETINLRYFNVYGPRQSPDGGYACLIPKFIKLISSNTQPTINGDGNQTRDFTYVSDVVEVNVLASKANNKECFGEAFNIGSGNNFSVNQITENLIKLSNKSIKPIHGPQVIEPKNTLADINKVKTLLRWAPKIKLQDGLRMTYEHFT